MSRRGRLDAVVVGGGVVGCAAALALAKRGLEVALLEASVPPAWQAAKRDLRVYAFAPDNAALLGDVLGDVAERWGQRRGDVDHERLRGVGEGLDRVAEVADALHPHGVAAQ